MSKRALHLLALCCGMLFGSGLMVSGMADPRRVLGFLDVTGRWDPTLLLVMTGAIGASVIPVRLAMRRKQALLGGMIEFPMLRDITGRLVLGSAMFGVGWGLCGVCPGPAWLNLLSLRADRWVFFACMLVGMGLFDVWNRRAAAAAARPPAAQPR